MIKNIFSKKYIFVILLFSLIIPFSFQTTKTMFTTIILNEASDKTVFAPHNLSYIDEEQTEIQKKEILSQIQEVYELNPTILKIQTENLNQFINSITEARTLMLSEENNAIENTEEETKKTNYFNLIENNYNLNEEQLNLFLQTNQEQLRLIKDIITKELEKIYLAGITIEKLEKTKEDFYNNTNFFFLGETVRETLVQEISKSLMANLIINKEETEIRKMKALADFKPVEINVKQGQLILQEGEIVQEIHIKQLEKFGLINNEFSTEKFFHHFPFVLLLLITLHLFLYNFSKIEMKNFRLYLFVFFATTVTVFLTNYFQSIIVTYLLFTTTLLLITTFLSISTPIFYSLLLALFINSNDYLFLIFAFILGVIFSLIYNSNNSKADRIKYIYTGVISGVILTLSYLILSFSKSIVLEKELLFILFSSPIASSVIVLGIFPILEPILKVVTSVKLYELTKPDHPLIKELMEYAPGTYHHSVKVGNLAEAAAQKIKANGLLLRVGAYFHDVGKIKNPLYFIENDIDKLEPHKKLTPSESAKIILKHPIDGVEICKKYKLPQIIIDLIETHHGDNLVEYFYFKEKEKNPNLKEKDFRYNTRLPRTKEEGILLLADTVEAASRTFLNKTPEEFSQSIKQLLYKKIETGQLRECELTIKEIEKICETFTEHLLRSNHKRIPYPKEK